MKIYIHCKWICKWDPFYWSFGRKEVRWNYGPGVGYKPLCVGFCFGPVEYQLWASQVQVDNELT